MTNDKSQAAQAAELYSLIAAVEEQVHAARPSPAAGLRTLDDIVGSAFVRELKGLSDAEAIRYLRSVDDTKLVEAYLVLSNRFGAAVLAEICRDYLARGTFASLLIGTQIGAHLYGTHDKGASRLLAGIIRDMAAQPAIRRNAYESLNQINTNESMLEYLRRTAHAEPIPKEGVLEGIDWAFVDSFL